MRGQTLGCAKGYLDIYVVFLVLALRAGEGCEQEGSPGRRVAGFGFGSTTLFHRSSIRSDSVLTGTFFRFVRYL